MERKEAYAKIKELNLQEECKKQYGKNFTQCSTDSLVKLINVETFKKSVNKDTKVKKAVTEKTIGHKSTMSIVYDLIETLHSKHILLDSEVKRIVG